MFDDKSRYAKLERYYVKDHRGRLVPVVPVPDAPRRSVMGLHLLQQRQRLDHLAFKYLKDGSAFWRIAEANEVMLPEALTEQAEITIPNKNP